MFNFRSPVRSPAKVDLFDFMHADDSDALRSLAQLAGPVDLTKIRTSEHDLLQASFDFMASPSLSAYSMSSSSTCSPQSQLSLSDTSSDCGSDDFSIGFLFETPPACHTQVKVRNDRFLFEPPLALCKNGVNKRTTGTRRVDNDVSLNTLLPSRAVGNITTTQRMSQPQFTAKRKIPGGNLGKQAKKHQTHARGTPKKGVSGTIMPLASSVQRDLQFKTKNNHKPAGNGATSKRKQNSNTVQMGSFVKVLYPRVQAPSLGDLNGKMPRPVITNQNQRRRSRKNLDGVSEEQVAQEEEERKYRSVQSARDCRKRKKEYIESLKGAMQQYDEREARAQKLISAMRVAIGRLRKVVEK